MKRTFLLSLTFMLTMALSAQDAVKTGYNLGVLPAISFNTDEGFQYGAVLNLFNYGNGSNYPKYDQSYYLEFSKFTKGSTVLRFYFDSEKLLKGVRTFADLSYITEDMLDFYGFNGYQSVYSSDTAKNNRAFYKMSQKQLRLLLDFKGQLPVEHLFWEASYNFVAYRNSAVDYDQLNKNTDFAALTPGGSLYEKYVGWGLLNPTEADGGVVNALKAGLVYDSRNVLNNPDKGVCSEILLEVAPSLLNESPYARYSILHRQYMSLVKDRLNLAFRIGAQGKLGDQSAPFFRRTVLMSPFATRTSPTALGGANSLRGILRNRVVGDGFLLGNFELRWKALNFRFINQNFYLGLNGFFDTGYIFDPVKMDLSHVNAADQASYFDLDTKDAFHSALGGGCKVVMNQNFIISVEAGKALDNRDGEGMGTYINLNYLF